MEKSLYRLFYEVEDTHWWFVATRTMAIKLLKQHCLMKQPSILDAGCGTGATMKLLSRIGPTHGVDVSHEALFYARKRGLKNVKLGSLTTLPYQEKQFDAAVALDVIEHIKDDTQALLELGRVIKKDGTLVVFVPAFRFLWSSHDALNHHYHRYTKGEIVGRIEQAGFAVLRAHYFGFSTFLPLLVKSLLERIGIVSPRFNIVRPLPSVLNTLLLKIYGVDLALSEWLLIPFGTSIIIVARRK